jgi:hypothetical protein
MESANSVPYRIIGRSLFSLVAIGWLVTSAIAQPAPKNLDDYKKKFKQGCEEGHGSYIENPDGSFQCNASSGNTIKCPNTVMSGGQCVSIPR